MEENVIPQPRSNRVLLKSLPNDLRSAPLDTRIIAPGQYAETSRLATVLAIGPEVEENGAVKPGQIVLCNRYPQSAQPFMWEGEELVTVREDEILAVVEGMNG